MKSRLTIFFDDQFWVGVFERLHDDQLEVARVTFGVEPADCQVLAFVQSSYSNLQFTRPVEADPESEKRINPKRLQRLVRKEVAVGVGTKAQEAFKRDLEAQKGERKRQSKEVCEEEKMRKFELAQQKRKAKHRGR